MWSYIWAEGRHFTFMTSSLAYGKRYRKEFYIFLGREFYIANIVLEYISLWP